MLLVWATLLAVQDKPFDVPKDYEVRLVAAEPDVADPVAIAVDAGGRLYVSESHTYRYGPARSPVRPVTNPIRLLELGPDGRLLRSSVAVEGFPEPVMGLAAHEGRLYATTQDELFVMTIAPDGKLLDRRCLVRDERKAWNPFGFYRVRMGPDGNLWFSVGDGRYEGKTVHLTGTDGRRVRVRGECGGVFRCAPDGSKLECVVQGLRTVFAFDFDAGGRLWLAENGEGSPNRLIEAVRGADYGYKTRPVVPGFLEGELPFAPPLRVLGPGSYTTLLFHRGGMLLVNWGSHGEAPRNRGIERFTSRPDGTLEKAAPFLTTSDPRFRPTQLAAGPGGDLYLLDWDGRDDESNRTGRVFRIIPRGPAPAPDPLPCDASAEQRFEDALAQDVVAAAGLASTPRETYRAGQEFARRGDPAAFPRLKAASRRAALVAADVAAHEGRPLPGASLGLLLGEHLAEPGIPPADFLRGCNTLRALGNPLDGGVGARFLELLRAGGIAADDRESRITALRLLPELPASDFLVRALRDGDPAVLREANLATRRLLPKDAATREAVLNATRSAKRSEARADAAYTLAALQEKPSLEAWRDLIGAKEPEVAAASFRALRRFSGDPAVAELLRGSAHFARETTRPGKDKAVLRAKLASASPLLGRLAFVNSPSGCIKCHRAGGVGGTVGPALDGLASAQGADYILESILEPSRIIKTGFEAERVETSDGDVLVGVVSRSGENLVVVDGTGEPRTLAPERVRNRKRTELSPMPEGLEAAMSEAELVDLVAWLLTLR